MYELNIIQCNQALNGDWIAIATFKPHQGKISGIGKTKELAEANARARMERMRDCSHLFGSVYPDYFKPRERWSREKTCEKCKIIIKEY